MGNDECELLVAVLVLVRRDSTQCHPLAKLLLVV